MQKGNEVVHTLCFIILPAAILVYFDQTLFHDDGSVKGIATVDVGVAKDGSPKVNIVGMTSVTWWMK